MQDESQGCGGNEGVKPSWPPGQGKAGPSSPCPRSPTLMRQTPAAGRSEPADHLLPLIANLKSWYVLTQQGEQEGLRSWESCGKPGVITSHSFTESHSPHS